MLLERTLVSAIIIFDIRLSLVLSHVALESVRRSLTFRFYGGTLLFLSCLAYCL